MRNFLICAALVALLIALTACDTPGIRHVVDAVEVKVPVVERAEAPKELWRSPIPASSLPYWIAPTDPKASACVSAENEPKLKSLLLGRESLLDGWEGYAAP